MGYHRWNNSNFGSWATVFSEYLSVSVMRPIDFSSPQTPPSTEFIDTWVLILKGRKPSLLQVYHPVWAWYSVSFPYFQKYKAKKK